MPLPHRLLAALCLITASLAASSASADTTSTTTLAKADFTFKIQKQDGSDWVFLSDPDAAIFFNRARCECHTPIRIVVYVGTGSRAAIRTGSTKGEARLYFNTNNCASGDARTRELCDAWVGRLADIQPLSKEGSWAVDTTVDRLFTVNGVTDCTKEAVQTIWLWISTNQDSTPDLTDDNAPNTGVHLDGSAPAQPAGVQIGGGNQALNISWAAPDDTVLDLAGYLVFCTRTDSIRVFSDSLYKHQYYSLATLTQELVCPAAEPVSSALLADGTSDSSTPLQAPAVQTNVPASISSLNPDFLCSGLLPTTATSMRLETLQNGIWYTVGVAAVDKSGNASPITTAFAQQPIPTRDFYQEYRDAGGQAEGGFCMLGRRLARPSALSMLAVGALVALTARRRRHRRARHFSGPLALLVVLFALPAYGQDEDSEEDTSPPDPSDALEPEDEDAKTAKNEPPLEDYSSPREWAFEARFGPYSPNIDSEFSGAATPHKLVFGDGASLMMGFELDWELFRSFGTLALGYSLGYFSESGKSFIADVATGASTGVRSGDDTSLRLIPMALLAVYRLDQAAEHWGFPLVPYVKAGLNYTFWKITDGNGNVPKINGGHGSGGTAGWQVAGGLSLRLDFLDPSAAHNFDAEAGVNHSYVFFEWTHINASGLWKSNALHVGDSTWVAGIMFEF